MRSEYVPVCIPREELIPRITRKMTSGKRPGGGAVLFLSVIATIVSTKTAVPSTSEKNADTSVK